MTDVVGIFSGPWDTGHASKDGAVLGFADLFQVFSAAAAAGEFELVTVEVDIFRDHRRIRDFLAGCDVVYANCGPWAALLHVVRERDNLDVRIIREVRTVGWVGYIWQEDVVRQLQRPGDKRVFPARYARDMWDTAMPGVSESRIYYPMIRGVDQHSGRALTGTVGFFSRLSEDKGLAVLPQAIERLQAAGNQISHLLLAGEQADLNLFDRIVRELTNIDVQVSYRGGITNDDVRKAMTECDCVFFLSTSSIEASGRVICEAGEQGVPVITADFGAGRDLVNADYRIPVHYRSVSSTQCASGFPLAALDVDRWTPPTLLSADACFQAALADYRVDAVSPREFLGPVTMDIPLDDQRRLAFTFTAQVDALALANQLLNDPNLMHDKLIHELVDLGGALKAYLLANGYNPGVNFEPRRV